MKLFTIKLCCLFLFSCQNKKTQISFSKIELSNNSKVNCNHYLQVKNFSNVIDTIWKDHLGENKFKVLKVENDEYQAETNIKMTFSLTNEKGTQKLIDSISDCPVEFHMNLIEKSIKLTDIDKDNIKELYYAYAYTCRGDMIGDTLKVVVIENNKIWSIKGLRTNLMNEQIAEFEKRKYNGFGTITESNVPEQFKKTATKLWLKYSKEKSIKSDTEVENFYNLK